MDGSIPVQKVLYCIGEVVEKESKLSSSRVSALVLALASLDDRL